MVSMDNELGVLEHEQSLLGRGRTPGSPGALDAARERRGSRDRRGADVGPEGEQLRASSVLIAAGDPRMRSQVRTALDGRGFEVVAEAADAAGAVAMAAASRPDVALLSTQMPGTGIRAAASISIAVPETAVVMYTDSHRDEDLFAALQAGARGYLWHDTDPLRLPLALKGVLAGEAAVPRELVARLLEEFRLRDRPRRLRLQGRRDVELTPREWDVLELLRQGLGTGEISSLLYISRVTVRTHISAILRKLEVSTRDEAVAAVGARAATRVGA
jgi:DNA-binding NarL/FixJ family response regulator